MKTTCPYCAEDIQEGAVRCPHCRSRLRSFTMEGWHRDHPEAMIAGVATAVAKAFAVPVVPVRVAFVALSFVQLAGVLAYLGLWLAIPKHAGEASLLESFLARALEAASRLSGRSSVAPGNGGTTAPSTRDRSEPTDSASDQAA